MSNNAVVTPVWDHEISSALKPTIFDEMRRRCDQLKSEIDSMLLERQQLTQRIADLRQQFATRENELVIGIEQRKGAIVELERMVAEMEKGDSGE